jgi:O-antigen ligase
MEPSQPANTQAPQAQRGQGQRFQAMFAAALPWLLCVAIASLPFYKGLFNTSIATYMVCWLLAGRFAERWRALTTPARYWLMLTAWVLIGMTYAGVPLTDLGKPTTFVLKAVFMLMAASAIEPRHWRWYVGAFVASNVWVVMLTLSWAMGYVPDALHERVGQWLARASTDHISQGIRLAAAAAVLMYLAQAACKVSWLKAALFALGAAGAAVVIGYFATGRTGYLALVAVAVVFVAWRRPLWRVVVGLLLVLLLSLVAYKQSSTVQERIDRIITESQMSGTARDHTSVGARLAMWSFALEAIQQRPLLGTGSGGYPQAASAHFSDPVTCHISCSHSHNQFLFFAVENGLIGLALYLAFILSALRAAWLIPNPAVSGAAASAMAVLVADSLTHGPFWIANEFALFAVMIPMMLSATPGTSRVKTA